MDTRKFVVCDIDDTVSVVGERRHLLVGEMTDWDKFYADDFNDEPIERTCEAVRRLMRNGIPVVFSTSRCERCRAKTLSWLHKHISGSITSDQVLMRPDECDKSEADQKVGLALSVLGFGNVILVIDDNRSVLDAWQRIGVSCVDSGEFATS